MKKIVKIFLALILFVSSLSTIFGNLPPTTLRTAILRELYTSDRNDKFVLFKSYIKNNSLKDLNKTDPEGKTLLDLLLEKEWESTNDFKKQYAEIRQLLINKGAHYGIYSETPKIKL